METSCSSCKRILKAADTELCGNANGTANAAERQLRANAKASEIPDFVFSDWMMFDQVMRNKWICSKFLETVLGIEVGDLEYVDSEKTIIPQLDAKPIRLNVFAREGKHIYNIEMQARFEPELGRRMRYYQGAMDASEADPGMSYSELPDSYIVFLCLNDPFGCGIPVYTICPTCDERASVPIGSGQTWVVLNASAWEDAPAGDLRELLQYTQCDYLPESTSSELVRRIDEEVMRTNDEARWKESAMGFMTLEHHWTARCKEAYKEGVELGEERFGKLAALLLENNRAEDLKEASNNETFRDSLFVEFKL